MLEIHQQKGEVVKDVDGSELVGKFEAIEQGRPAFEQADIAKMQVAVAPPHFSGGGPPVEQGADRGEPLQRLLPDLDDPLSGEPGISRRHQAGVVRLDDGGQRRRAAVTRARFGCLMKGGDVVGEPRHQGRIQPMGFGELIEQRCVIEAPHHHDPIDDQPLRPEADLARGGAAQTSNLEIEVRGGAAIEGIFVLARGPALLDSRKIEIRKLYRALEFISAVTGREKPVRHGFR